MLTQARLKELFAYCPETGIFVRLIAPGKRSDLTGEIAGSKYGQGYLHINVDGRKYKAHRLAWFYVYGVWPKGRLDHKNLHKDDNRIDNLREATASQNEQNKLPNRANTSGVKGVYWSKCAKKWQAYIKKDGKFSYLGIFEDLADAAGARRNAEIEMFGEFAPGCF